MWSVVMTASSGETHLLFSFSGNFCREIDKALTCWGFPGGTCGKESACNAVAAGDLGSIPGSGRSPGGGHGGPLQCSCLENPMDRGSWWATVHGLTKQLTTTEVTWHAHVLTV